MASIRSIEEYVVAVNEIADVAGLEHATTHLWYRGQSDSRWNLVPGLYRGEVDPDMERELIRDFQLYAPWVQETSPAGQLDWLFIMQHHGMPTRLLDWTESYLIGLYFSVLDWDNPSNGAVWVLHPWALNSDVLNQRTVPTVDHPGLRGHILDQDPVKFERSVRAQHPVALRPTRGTARIASQKGMFTIHGSDPLGLDKFAVKARKRGGPFICKKIDVNGKAKFEILKNIYAAGISSYSLFPELDGLSKELRFRYSNKYRGLE